MQDDKICYDVCTSQNVDDVAKLALKLWNDADYDELKDEFEAVLETESNIVCAAYCQEKMIVFAHCSLRNEYVEGADTDNVAYLEGIYVEQQFRNCGVASCLMQCCENWAKSKGCKQFASDCEINNLPSISMHKKYGFNESAKLVHFIKNIGG